MGRVGDRKAETAFQARVAHSVAAFELCGLRTGYVVGKANQTFDSAESQKAGQDNGVGTNSLSGSWRCCCCWTPGPKKDPMKLDRFTTGLVAVVGGRNWVEGALEADVLFLLSGGRSECIILVVALLSRC